MLKRQKKALIREFFMTLFRAWGRQHWWPAESRFEVIVGAFLTQNTAWTNVEIAIDKLRTAGLLSLEGVRRTPVEDLEQLIRSAGYFRQKAKRLKMFVSYLDVRYGGSLEQLFERPTEELRSELLELNGIGPETADSILLYAGNYESFVVDAYTRRILERHGLISANADYEEIRQLCDVALSPEFAETVQGEGSAGESGEKPPGAHHHPSAMSEICRSNRAQVFNEMHALLVGVAKNYCHRRQALCESCPLSSFLEKPVTVQIIERAPQRTIGS